MPGKELLQRDSITTAQQQAAPQSTAEDALLDQQSNLSPSLERVGPGAMWLSPQYVRHLQRTIGNQAVGRLLATAAHARVPSDTRTVIVEGQTECETNHVHAPVVPELPENDDDWDREEYMHPDEKVEFSTSKTSGGPSNAYTPAHNVTGMPDNLKSSIEALSGYAMDDVRVHYNAQQPGQMQALAYTEGHDIYIGPGQEQHLPHEAWHVVQQKQRRVPVTAQFKGIAINADPALEAEADQMARQALHATTQHSPTQLRTSPGSSASSVRQCRMGFEFETGVHVRDSVGGALSYKVPVFRRQGAKWHVHADGSYLEFVTDPTSDEGDLISAIQDMKAFMDAAQSAMQDEKNVKAFSFTTKERTFDQLSQKWRVEQISHKITGVPVQTIIDRMKVQVVKEETSPTAVVGFEGATFGFAGKPQVTFGVPLEQLLNFMLAASVNETKIRLPSKEQRVGGKLATTYPKLESPLLPPQQDHPDFINFFGRQKWQGVEKVWETGSYKTLRDQLRQTATKQSIEPLEVDKVVGLYAIVFRHINDMSVTFYQKTPFEYIKSAFGLLHRSDFHAMYSSLSPKGKTLFNIQTILDVANWKDQRLDTPMVNPEVVEFAPVPTLRQWLSSIINPAVAALPKPYVDTADKYTRVGVKPGKLRSESPEMQTKDLLSRGEAVSNSSSMGSFAPDTTDLKLPRSTLHLFEVRNLVGGGLASQLPYEQWETLAREVFAFYRDWVLNPQNSLEVEQDEQDTWNWRYT